MEPEEKWGEMRKSSSLLDVCRTTLYSASHRSVSAVPGPRRAAALPRARTDTPPPQEPPIPPASPERVASTRALLQGTSDATAARVKMLGVGMGINVYLETANVC